MKKLTLIAVMSLLCVSAVSGQVITDMEAVPELNAIKVYFNDMSVRYYPDGGDAKHFHIGMTVSESRSYNAIKEYNRRASRHYSGRSRYYGGRYSDATRVVDATLGLAGAITHAVVNSRHHSAPHRSVAPAPRHSNLRRAARY